MKLTVVTPYDSANFGAFLQAYCLKIQLENMGHLVTHVPTRDADYVKGLYYSEKPITKRDRLMRWNFSKKKSFGKQKWSLFQEEHKEFNVKNISDAYSDVFILGSDEVWNINSPPFRKPMFWGSNLKPVISYAASIGNAKLDDYENYYEQINGVRKLSSALVRDGRTKQFVEHYTDLEAHEVCDPTMLVPINSYGKEIKDDFLIKNKCLLIYAYRVTNKQKKAIKLYAKKYNLKIVACCFYHSWCDHQINCGPLQFSSLIQQCEAIITTTFHGSIFSMLNHANFVTIPTSVKSNQLLEYYGLNERMIHDNDVSLTSIENILNGKLIDYEQVDLKISELRKRSITLLEQSLNSAISDKKFDYQICPSDDCTACFACLNICPVSAISSVVDYLGRTVPQIDPLVCTECGLCKRTCPQLNPVGFNEPVSCYAAQRINKEERMKSASGGIGALLTEFFLNNGNPVYGAAVKQGGVVEHMRATSLEEGNKFKNSKYVQSDIGYIFKDVLAQLKLGKEVLFTGTPCQIAGLKKFLGRPFDGLYCIDIVCHGVPPMRYFEEYLKSISKDKSVDAFSFRGGKGDFNLKVFSNGEEVYNKNKNNDLYYYSFLKSLTYRENCYNCTYAKKERCSDMTIGDFWGLDRSTLSTEQSGNISLILVNSEKGSKLLSLIESNLICEKREVDEAINGNAQLRNPSKPHKKRSIFMSNYIKTNDFGKTMKNIKIKNELYVLNIKRTMVWRALRKIKRMLLK